MKKLLLLLITFSLFSCALAQQTEQVPIYTVNAWISDIVEDKMILQPNNSTYRIIVAADSTSIINKEYTWWIEITDCITCRTVVGVVALEPVLTSAQIQRDSEANNKKISHRKKIRLKR